MQQERLSMQKNNKVQRVPRRLNINIGVIIFIIILLYTILNIYLYISKPQIAIYEVAEQSLAQDNRVTAIITREESVVTSSMAGYINYYFRDGAKVAKDATIFSVDENKQIYEKLEDNSDGIPMSEDDIDDIKNTILKYKKKYSNDNYSMIYDFKDDVSAKIREVIDTNLLDNMQKIVNETGIAAEFNVVKTNQTGVLSYYSDNYDGLKENGITKDIFDQNNYVQKILRSKDIVEANQPVYKIITSDQWSVTAPIDQTLADKLKERKSLKFTFVTDNITTRAPFSVYQNGEDWYLKIDLDKYVVNFSRERFLELDLDLSNESGLKIPKSAIVEKEFYLIPNDYFVKGGNSEEEGVMVERFDEAKSEIVPTFTACEVYYKDDTYSYVDKDTFEFNDFIVNITTNDRCPISMVGTLQGVYNVNKGFAVFRRIEVLEENKEYAVVKKGTEQGISLYDHIALNASLASESSVIY
jgi:hypothetical protein